LKYYKRNLGDYAKDTKWLTTYQHGVYVLLLDWYYTNEKPIPADIVYRIVAARSGPERKAVDEVVATFFDVTKQAGFVHHKRADFEVAKYKCNSETNSLNRKGTDTTVRSDSVDVSSSVRATDRDITKNQEPRKKEKTITPIVPKGDSESSLVVDAYHRTLPKCQRVAVMNDKRKKRIATATKLARHVCEAQGWEYTPAEFLEAYFAECGNDPWMRGEVPNQKNPAWVQNLDVLLAEDRFANVMDRAIAAMRGGYE
jgi:uncharacterized protein YdaU (DUF1376 family)